MNEKYEEWYLYVIYDSSTLCLSFFSLEFQISKWNFELYCVFAYLRIIKYWSCKFLFIGIMKSFFVEWKWYKVNCFFCWFLWVSFDRIISWAIFSCIFARNYFPSVSKNFTSKLLWIYLGISLGKYFYENQQEILFLHEILLKKLQDFFYG